MSNEDIYESLTLLFKQYCNEYAKIFKYMDPRIEANRFNEENQTVNFCRSIQSIFNDAIVWYEYPWKTKDIAKGNTKNSCYRFDAVIYIPSKQSLFVIEAKCLRKKTKYEAMNKDLERLCGKLTELENGEKVLINIPNPKNIYAVILADYWLHPNARSFKATNTEWCKNKSASDIEFKTFKDNINNWLCDPEWYISDTENFANYKNYYLMAIIGQIKNPKGIYTFEREE